MIGSSLNLEPNYAGRQGPRNCDPLLFSPPNRIQRAQPLWYTPQVKRITVSGPTQLTSLVTSRAVLAFIGRFTLAGGTAGGIVLCIGAENAAAARGTKLLWDKYIVSGSSSPVTFTVAYELSYERDGALTVQEWWANTIDGASAANVTVTEVRYFG